MVGIFHCLQLAPVLQREFFSFSFFAVEVTATRKPNKLCPPQSPTRTYARARAQTFCKKELTWFGEGGRWGGGGQAAPITLKTRPDSGRVFAMPRPFSFLFFFLPLFFSVTDSIEHVTDLDAHMAAAAA